MNLIEKFGAETQLFDIADAEFVTGGAITEAVKTAGYDVNGHVFVNDNSAWSMTVAEFVDLLEAAAPEQA
jgi:hypothetical protein